MSLESSRARGGKKKEYTGFEASKEQNLRANPKDLFNLGEAYFDQNEDEKGDKMNLATGKAFDNSTDLGMTGLDRVIDIPSKKRRKSGTEDLLGDIGDGTENDATAQWIKEQEAKMKRDGGSATQH